MNVIAILMSATLATLDLLKKLCFEKGYDFMIPLQDVTNKILFRDPNYTVDVVRWPNFGNSNISMREVWMPMLETTEFYKNLTRNDQNVEGWSWFKFNNLGFCSPIHLQ